MVRPFTAVPYSWYQFVLVMVTIAVLKHHDQKELEKGRVYVSYTSRSLFMEGRQGRNSSKPRTLGHFPDADAMKGSVYWLAGLSFLSWFSIDPRNISPKMIPSIVFWALPYQTLKKMSYMFVYSPIL